jgi:hypothetical protein
MTATAETAPETAKPPKLLHNRSFRLLWIGQSLSDFGSTMTFLVLPLVLLGTGSSTWVAGALGTVALVAGLVIRMPAGYLADRFDQRRLMLTCDLVRMVLIGAVAAFSFAGHLPLALAFGSIVVSVVAMGVFRPAQNKVVRRAVPVDQLASAVSLNQARSYAAAIAAPAAGGLLIAVQPGLPFAVDAVTFAVSALCVALLPKTRQPAPAVQEGILRQLSAGWRYLIHDRFLRSSVLFFAVMNFVFAALGYGIVLGAGTRPDGAVAVGVAMSSAAVAGLIGSLVAPYLQKRWSTQTIYAVGPAAATVLLAVAWLSGSTVAFVAAYSALCLLLPLIGAALSTSMAIAVPEEIYGRVTSATSFVSETLQPAGPFVAGLLLAALSLSGSSLAFAVAFGVLAVLALLLPAAQAVSRAGSAHH